VGAAAEEMAAAKVGGRIGTMDRLTNPQPKKEAKEAGGGAGGNGGEVLKILSFASCPLLVWCD